MLLAALNEGAAFFVSLPLESKVNSAQESSGSA
jgi:hypothetical protein